MAKRRASKEVRKIDKIAREHGFQLVRQNKHLVYKHPRANRPFVVSKSSSDVRSFKNNLSELKKLLREMEA